MGMGVTAFSLEDAFSLLDERAYGFHRSGPVVVREGVTVADLDPLNIVSHMGPIVFRGIWYPCWNVGLGASGAGDDGGVGQGA